MTRDVHPIEEAEGYDQLMKQHGYAGRGQKCKAKKSKTKSKTDPVPATPANEPAAPVKTQPWPFPIHNMPSAQGAT